jgi:cell division protein FtsL
MSRPKGSRNKPKEIKETSQEIKRIKAEIKDLRAKKRLLPKGNADRIKLHREMQELKKLLAEKKEAKTELIKEVKDPDKDPIIADILKLEAKLKIVPTFEDLGIDLHIHSVKDLKIHLEKLKAKVRA